MVIFHISERKNRESIFKSGILPSRVRYPNHLESFHEYGVVPEDQKSATYFWVDSDYNEKYIKDLIYCKMFLHPRDEIADNYLEKYDDLYNFKNHSNSPIPLSRILFDVYKVKLPDTEEQGFIHSQYESDDCFSPLFRFDDKFSHLSKPLYIASKVVKNFTIVGNVLYDYDIDNDSVYFKFDK